MLIGHVEVWFVYCGCRSVSSFISPCDSYCSVLSVSCYSYCYTVRDGCREHISFYWHLTKRCISLGGAVHLLRPFHHQWLVRVLYGCQITSRIRIHSSRCAIMTRVINQKLSERTEMCFHSRRQRFLVPQDFKDPPAQAYDDFASLR